MRKLTRKQLLSLVLCLLLAAFSFLSVALSTAHARTHHGCYPETCTACAALEGTRTLMRHILLLALIALALWTRTLGEAMPTADASSAFAPITLISLKVRLNP